MKRLFVILILIMGCSTKYTGVGEKKVISHEDEHVTYDIKAESEPTVNFPYLTYDIREKVQVKETYKQKFKIEKTPKIISFVPLLTVGPALFLGNSGWVTLGRDIIGLSLFVPISVYLGLKLLPSREKELTRVGTYAEWQVPTEKKFTVMLAGEDYTVNYFTDKNGKLEIPLVDFAPYYKEGKSFNFSLISEEGQKIMGRRIATSPFSSLLAKIEEADVNVNIPKTAMSSPEGVAVVIGVKQYSNPDVPNVDYALNDAKIMKEYLINVFGYEEGNIIYVENPSKGTIEKVFGTKENPKGQLYNWVKPDLSDVFVYYSGHGAPAVEEKKSYLVPADADPSYVKMSGYSLELLFDNIRKIPAKKKTVIIDACFSGNTHRGMLLKRISPLTIAPIIEKRGYKDMFILTASQEDQVSGWYQEKKHGLFTYFFLKGLRGNADLDGDKTIIFQEMQDYLNLKVPYYARRLHGREQNPLFTGEAREILVKW